jgi:hypothetical protein
VPYRFTSTAEAGLGFARWNGLMAASPLATLRSSAVFLIFQRPLGPKRAETVILKRAWRVTWIAA